MKEKLAKSKFYKIIGLIFLLILIIFIFGGERDYRKTVSKEVGFDVTSCELVKQDIEELRDSTYFLELDCSNANILDYIKDWKELPFAGKMEILMFRVSKDGVYYEYDMSGKYGIPKIENGYYYFVDLYSKNYSDLEDIYSEDYLFEDGHGLDFIVVQYDLDSGHFYYLKYFS